MLTLFVKAYELAVTNVKCQVTLFSPVENTDNTGSYNPYRSLLALLGTPVSNFKMHAHFFETNPYLIEKDAAIRKVGCNKSSNVFGLYPPPTVSL